jgi:hypothetical protein
MGLITTERVATTDTVWYNNLYLSS